MNKIAAKKLYIYIKKNRSRKKEGVATNYNVCQGLLLALVSPASNAKVQKIFAHMSKTFAWALCFRFLFFFFFCVLFALLVVLAKNTQFCTAPAEEMLS